MRIRKLSAWSSFADNHAWLLVGVLLKENVIEVLGEDRTVDQQFGNILGCLRDCGEHTLAREVVEAIEAHNAQYECPSCKSDLSWEPKEERWYCGFHGYIDRF